jgi:hypothetical protein
MDNKKCFDVLVKREFFVKFLSGETRWIAYSTLKTRFARQKVIPIIPDHLAALVPDWRKKSDIKFVHYASPKVYDVELVNGQRLKMPSKKPKKRSEPKNIRRSSLLSRSIVYWHTMKRPRKHLLKSDSREGKNGISSL